MSAQGFLVALALTYGVLAATSEASAECARAKLVAPSPDTVIHEVRPRIEWEPLDGVQAYRLVLRSRVPEGQVVTSLDTIVQGNRFTPPHALTDTRAIVRVVVTAQCPDDPTPVEAGSMFFIDAAPLCEMGTPRIEAGDGTSITWAPVANAVEYEVHFYEMPESRLVEKARVVGAQVSIPKSLARPAVAAIRPKCPTGFGDLRFLLLTR